MLLSSHLLTELEERTDRIAILDRGRLVAEGTLDDLGRQAGLPLRFRVRVAPGRSGELAERLGWPPQRLREETGTSVLDCPPADKMPLLRRLAALDDLVTDIDMQPPRLNDVYAHFTGANGQ